MRESFTLKMSYIKLPKIILILAIVFAPMLFIDVKKLITNIYYPVSNKVDFENWNGHKKVQPNSNLPNIILIITDDLGIHDVSYMKNTLKLRDNGIEFTKAYSTHATCAPSRASILTGKFPLKIGMEFTPHPASLDFIMYFQSNVIRNNLLNMSSFFLNPSMKYMALNSKETLLSQILNPYYYNYYIGKWHLGETKGYTPIERGFDESLAFLYAASLYAEKNIKNVISEHVKRSLYDFYALNFLPFGISYNNRKMFRPNMYMTDYLTDSAIKAIEKSENGKPFFITLAYNAPHNPYQALKEDYDQAEGEHIEKIYKGMLNSVDRGIGYIVDSLKRTNKYNNTLIIFTSDNGATHLPEIDDLNFPLSGWKCTFFEGGLRVPMFWQWPNRINPGTKYEKTVSLVDIFASLESLVGKKSNIDGVNLFPFIENRKDGYPHETLFWRAAEYKSIKYQDWKLSMSDTGTWLFNLKDDPREFNNLWKYQDTNETIKTIVQLLESKIEKEEEEIIKQERTWYSPMKMPTPIYSSNINSTNDEFIYWSI